MLVLSTIQKSGLTTDRLKAIDYFFLIRLLPVISGGTGKPIAVSIVGAMSHNAPPLRNFLSRSCSSTIMKGTLFVVCAVKGLPSSASIFSALP